MRKISILAVFAMVLTLAEAALSQTGSSNLPSLPEGSVHLWNGTNKSVVFYLSVDDSNYTKYTIEADDTEQLAFNTGIPIFYAIKTGEKLVKGKLYSQQRYRIVLKKTDVEYFDILEIKE